MKRTALKIDDIADLHNLVWATWRAALGKRHRREVQAFLDNVWAEIGSLAAEVLAGQLRFQPPLRFRIWDPKPRWIHAPVFRERVLHHALMRHLGPVLDRSLVDDTFACREGKGSLAAVARVQTHLRRYGWFVKVDVRQYFPSIHHKVLLGELSRRIKGTAVLDLCRQIVTAHADSAGRGLPIGALTSQHFANLYLAPLDRFLLEGLNVAGMVRYMDDVVWWTRSKNRARETLVEARRFVAQVLRIELKEPAVVQPSRRGLTFCGFRVHRGAVRITPRRKQRYVAARRRWEERWARGEIGDQVLRAGYASALQILAHADAGAWRRAQLERRPAPEV